MSGKEGGEGGRFLCLDSFFSVNFRRKINVRRKIEVCIIHLADSSILIQCLERPSYERVTLIEFTYLYR